MTDSENCAKKSILEKIKNNKKIQYAIIILLTICVAIICFSTSNKELNTASDEVTINQYVDDIENRLSKTLSKVDGVGKVSVVITVESGMETVLAMKTTTTENTQGKEIVETPVIVNGKTVVLKELYPKITGVLIVAEGADKISIVRKIQQATVSLLDVDVGQIEILTMK